MRFPIYSREEQVWVWNYVGHLCVGALHELKENQVKDISHEDAL